MNAIVDERYEIVADLACYSAKVATPTGDKLMQTVELARALPIEKARKWALENA